MRVTLRSIVAIVLALLIAGTSQTMATARGQTAVAGEVVLCIGAQTVVVTVDANGQPTEHPHICPDCAMLLLVGLTGPEQLPPRLIEGAEPHLDALQIKSSAVWPNAHRARGPPLRDV